MLVVAIFPVAPPPSSRRERMSSGELIGLDQHLEDHAPASEPNVRIEDDERKPDPAALTLSQLQVEAQRDDAQVQYALLSSDSEGLTHVRVPRDVARLSQTPRRRANMRNVYC